MLKVFTILLVSCLFVFESKADVSGPKRSKEGVIPFKEITFFLQPFEAAGTHCKFHKLEASHDYVVYCGAHEFQVHFLARPYRQRTQEAFEILMMVNENSSRNTSESSTLSVWVKNSKGSETQNILASLGVLKNTAFLDVRVTL